MAASSPGGGRVAPRSTWRTWLQLFRAPNLFTVPGDPLVGYLLASPVYTDARVLLAIAASLCFYAAGLLLNDLADLAEDRAERPMRPLPSGAADPRRVRLVAVCLNLGGVLFLAVTGRPLAIGLGVALIAAIYLYNYRTKHLAVIGALNMGLCRTLSVLLGASLGEAFALPLAATAAVGIGLFIAAVTNLARHETKSTVPAVAKVLPSLVAILLAIGGITYAVASPERLPAVAVHGVIILTAIMLLARLFRQPPAPIPPLIGAHIRLLLPLQASFAYLAGPEPGALGFVSAICLLALWPVAKTVSRWFYAS